MKATRCLWSLPGQKLFLDNSFAKPHALSIRTLASSQAQRDEVSCPWTSVRQNQPCPFVMVSFVNLIQPTISQQETQS